MSVSRPHGAADDAVVIRASVWVRLWVPLLGAAVAFIAGVLQVSEGRAPWQFLAVAVLVGLMVLNSRPLLHADAFGIRVGPWRRVPWSEVAEFNSPPDDGRKHPFELLTRDGKRRALWRDLSPDDVRRIENLLVASRREGAPPV